MEFGSNVDGNLAPWSHYDIISFPVISERYDFPVSLQVSVRLILYYLHRLHFAILHLSVRSVT